MHRSAFAMSRIRPAFLLTMLTTFGIGGLFSPISPNAVAQDSAGVGAQSGFASTPPRTAGPTPAPSTTSPKKFSLADFAWLPGRWLGQWGPRVADQIWTPARAGTMVGIFRIVETDKTLVIELLALTETPSGIEYRIRHFTPDLVPWEKSGSTVLNLSSLDARNIVFDNPVDGQPKHTILDRVDDDTYILHSEIVPLQGDPQVVEITFRRQKPTAKKP